MLGILAQEPRPEQLTPREAFCQAEAQGPQAWLPLEQPLLPQEPPQGPQTPCWAGHQPRREGEPRDRICSAHPDVILLGERKAGQHQLQGAQMGEIC